MERYDAIVVGGGPAGVTASFFLSHLSSSSLSVLCLEKLGERCFDRYHHMCGETVSARTFHDVAPIRPSGVRYRITRAVEHWPGGIEIEVPVDGYVLDRPAFIRSIKAMAMKEGSDHQEDSVVKVRRESDEYEVLTRSGKVLRSRYLIGADGWNSIVRRTFFDAPPRMLWAEQHILADSTDEDTMHFHYDARYAGGYKWVFPHPLGSRIGFTKGTEEMHGLQRHVRPIPYGGMPSIVAGEAALIGDAAGQANPITFGGIRTGMVAAKLMSESLVSGGLDGYQSRWGGLPYSSGIYSEVFETLKNMDNDELGRSAEPFRNGYGRASYLKALIRGWRFRSLYKAYDMAGKWGW